MPCTSWDSTARCSTKSVLTVAAVRGEQDGGQREEAPERVRSERVTAHDHVRAPEKLQQLGLVESDRGAVDALAAPAREQ